MAEADPPPQPREREEREEEEVELLHLLGRLTQVLATRSAPQVATTVPDPALEKLLPAAHAALTDTVTPLQNRDRYEIQVLLNIAEALGDSAIKKAEDLIAQRLQLLLTARLHGWGFARRVIDYTEATAAGIYAPPPGPPTSARGGLGRGRRGRGRGRGRGTTGLP